MGMYTEIYVNVNFKKSLPSSIVNMLRAMCYIDVSTDQVAIELKDKPTRWQYLFNNGSYYFPSTQARNLTYNAATQRLSLTAKGDIKNYEEEIEQFFACIAPHIDASPGDFIGYKRHEEDRLPTLVCLGENGTIQYLTPKENLYGPINVLHFNSLLRRT